MLILFQNIKKLFYSFQNKNSIHFLPTFQINYNKLLKQITKKIHNIKKNQSHLLSLNLITTQILTYLYNQKIYFQLYHSTTYNKNQKKPHKNLNIYIYFFKPTIYSKQFTFIIHFPSN